MLLIQHTGIRPGSDRDTKAEKRAYGATTLRAEHIIIKGGEVRLVFTGKKGVDLDIPVKDPRVAKLLVSRKREVKSGRLFNISDTDLRDYASDLDGGKFHPKDFRTAVGTQTAIEEMRSLPTPRSDKEYKSSVREVASRVSKRLGNTPTIALQSYIDPTVFSKWRITG
jgi:DNA topoisomerase-1